MNEELTHDEEDLVNRAAESVKDAGPVTVQLDFLETCVLRAALTLGLSHPEAKKLRPATLPSHDLVASCETAINEVHGLKVTAPPEFWIAIGTMIRLVLRCPVDQVLTRIACRIEERLPEAAQDLIRN